MRILGICGSLQKKSSNLTLLQTAQSLMPDGVSLELYDGLASLPHFNPDQQDDPPAAVIALRSAIAESAALLIACPEYGFSLPGSLKNAIDWLIGTGELERKVIGVTAATHSPERGLMGLQALLQTLGAVSARVVGGKPIARGAYFEAEIKALVDAVVREANVPASLPQPE